MSDKNNQSVCPSSKSAADVLMPWGCGLTVVDAKIYPPDVLAEAKKRTDPQVYLETWLKLQLSTLKVQLLRGKFIQENCENLLKAGFTSKQLMEAVESGESFDTMHREACIKSFIPTKYQEMVRKLNRFRAAWRFPLDFMGLYAARRAVKEVVNRMPQKPLATTAEFLPKIEGRITSINCKWKQLQPQEITTIEASRDTALERTFTLSPGERVKVTEFEVLRDSYSLPAYLKPRALEPYQEEILNAVAKSDLDFFVRLGEYLKKAKTEAKKADAAFIRRFQQQRLALFLIEHWLPSPRLRGTWLYEYLSKPNYFAKSGVHLSPCWLSSGALLITLGERQPAKRSETPCLCFFGDNALAKVCCEILNTSFKKDTVNKTVKRLGLKRCPRNGLIFTQIEKNNDKLVAYRSSPRRTN